MEPCKIPNDPEQKSKITCAECGTKIDFNKDQVFINGPSYVCEKHSKSHLATCRARMKKTLGVKKLSPKPDDLLVFIIDADVRKEPEETMLAARKLLKNIDCPCHAIIVPKGYSLKSLDEKQMRKIGWQRI
jgi:hypothetical protein